VRPRLIFPLWRDWDVPHREDAPRDDLVVTLILLAVVVLIALVPYFLRRLGYPPTDFGYIETLDLILGPVIVAGGIGVYLEDRAHAARRG
jgi:hypothetical protein